MVKKTPIHCEYSFKLTLTELTLSFGVNKQTIIEIIEEGIISKPATAVPNPETMILESETTVLESEISVSFSETADLGSEIIILVTE